MRNSDKSQLLNRRQLERSADHLAEYLSAVEVEVAAEVDARVEADLAAMGRDELVSRMRDQFDRYEAINHDYGKIAAGIVANLDRLKRRNPDLANAREVRAIEGAARRLGDIPSLFRVLRDPSIVNRWDDVTNQRLINAVEAVYHILEPTADERGVVLHRPMCRQGFTDAEVRISRRALGGMVLQLLDNAISYSRVGEHVSVAVDVPDVGDTCSVIVESFGPEIDPRDSARIFRPFERGESAQAEREGGGVGLAIVRAICDEVGGDITYRQEPRGDRFRTEFILSLPRVAS